MSDKIYIDPRMGKTYTFKDVNEYKEWRQKIEDAIDFIIDNEYIVCDKFRRPLAKIKR